MLKVCIDDRSLPAHEHQHIKIKVPNHLVKDRSFDPTAIPTVKDVTVPYSSLDQNNSQSKWEMIRDISVTVIGTASIIAQPGLEWQFNYH